MSKNPFVTVGLSVSLALAVACTKSSAPGAPTAPTADSSAAPDGSTLKVTAPTPVAPVNDAPVTASATVLTATAAAGKYAAATGPLQYRFELFNDAGTKVQDSGLMASPSFTVTTTLDFKKRYTWHARAELQRLAGPWS